MKWFAGTALLLLIALVFDLGLLAYAMYAVIGLLVVSRILSSYWIRQLSATRECNRLNAEVGDTVAVIVTLHNSGCLPVPWVLLEDLLPRQALIHRPPNLQLQQRPIKLQMVGRQPCLLTYQLKCNRRGYYQLGPLVIETGDLFGLHRRFRVATEPNFLLVYPRVIPLEGYDIASRRPIGEVRMGYRLYEDPTRIAGVRRHDPSDPLNRVHWPATARTATLHSKVYEPSTVSGATLLLDYHIQSYDKAHEPFRSELAITAAASIANALYQIGRQVGLITNGRDAADRVRQQGWDSDYRTRHAARQSAGMRDSSDRMRPVVVETRRGPEQLMRILEALARAELTDGLSLDQLVLDISGHIERNATVIALLQHVTTPAAIALGNLVRRGFAVTALVNVFNEYEFAEASGPLLAQGVPTHHLKDESHVPTVCQSFVLARA